MILQCVDCCKRVEVSDFVDHIGTAGEPPHCRIYGFCPDCDGFLQRVGDAEFTCWVNRVGIEFCETCHVFNAVDHTASEGVDDRCMRCPHYIP